MRIGIVGKGNVASCLGPLWAARGHQVTYGVRDPDHPQAQALLACSGPSASLVTTDSLSQLAEVILLSVRWSDVPEVLRSLGDISGKILIDCTCPLEKGNRRLLFGHTSSAGERIAAMVPSAHVVKAFDTAGVRTMERPIYQEIRATMFICGDDANAKQTVGGLAEELGFDVCDAGTMEVARYLEPLAMLWVHLAFFQGFGKDIGFKLLSRDEVGENP